MKCNKTNKKPRPYGIVAHFIHNCLPKGRHSEAAHEIQGCSSKNVPGVGVGWGMSCKVGWGGVCHVGVGWGVSCRGGVGLGWVGHVGVGWGMSCRVGWVI